MNKPGRVTSVNYSKPYRPFPIAAYNRVGRLLGSAGFKGADLRSGSLMERSAKKTGLTDFGEPSFRERMEILLHDMENEARFHRFGRFMARENIVRILVNRLRIEDYFKKDPSILKLEMEDPVFIVGLQRTGTTKLQRLLSCDPGFRYLSSWEAINPAPFPGIEHSKKDPRIKQAELARNALKYMAPDFFAIHPIAPRGPEEDCMLFDYAFWGTVPEATYRVPSFSKYLEEQDHSEAYRYYKTVLQLLMRQRNTGRWLHKTPQHLEQLEALFTVFPKAKIIHTHRDPVKVLASFCSMISHAWGVFSDRVDPREVGQHWSAKQYRMIRRSLEVRDRRGEESFLDVSYYDLIENPMNEVERIYRFLGRELTGETRTAMAAWLGENPKDRHGRHRYRLEDFGLERHRVEEEFADYRRRFDIRREDFND